MKLHAWALFTALIAALIFTVAVTAASAGSLSVSNQRFRTVWNSLEIRMSAGTVRCPVTLEGSFHSGALRKTVGALIGSVSRATTVPGACTGGTYTYLQEVLPWHIRYRGFRGMLPTLTGVLYDRVGLKALISVAGQLCTTQTTAANPSVDIINIESRGRVTSVSADESVEIPLRGLFFCGLAGTYSRSGTAAISLLGTTSAISVRLI